MPFITARVVSVTRADTLPLGFVSAGNDQSVLCATLVQLEAVIIGDITQHTFEWEQSFGTPVTLLNPLTLTPSFVNPQTSEIIFTFYTDRNTPFEQSDDVLISRRPTDIMKVISTGDGSGFETFSVAAPTSSNVLMPQFRDLNVRLTNDTYNDPPPNYSPIYTATDLDKVREDLQGNYWLMNDIDLSSYSNWDPIGRVGKAFTGELQGNGYTIQNMTINNTTRDIGLFDRVGDGALIEKVGVTDANVTGGTSWYASIMFGSAGRGHGGSPLDGGAVTVRDCYTSGTVDAGGDRAGGFIGYCGTNVGSIYENNYADVTVTGTTTDRVGGFLGFFETECTYTENYSNTTKTALIVGSIAPDNPPGATEISGLTTAQLTAEANFTGWDFISTWEIDEGVTPPTVQEQNDPSNRIKTGGDCENYMISWGRPDSRKLQGLPTGTSDGAYDIGYTFSGSYLETLTGTVWGSKMFVSAEQNHISVDPGTYRLTTIWTHTATGVITNDVEIIHTTAMIAPSLRPGGADALRATGGASISTIPVIVIQNPRKISKSDTDTFMILFDGGSTTSGNTLIIDRNIGAWKDAGSDTMVGLYSGYSSLSGALVLARSNGASIG